MNEAQKLIKELKGLGYTQKEIAQFVKTHEPNISWYFYGKTTPKEPMLAKLREMVMEHQSRSISPKHIKMSNTTQERMYNDDGEIMTSGVAMRSARSSNNLASLDQIRDTLAPKLDQIASRTGYQMGLALLVNLGVSQIQVAEFFGVSPQYISNFLNSRLVPSKQVLLHLYEVLEKCLPDDTPEWIFTLREEILPKLEQEIHSRESNSGM